MARHSNEALTAERKELAAALELEPGETLAQALARKSKEQDAKIEKLTKLVTLSTERAAALEEQLDQEKVEAFTADAAPIEHIQPSASAPLDTAFYPAPGKNPPPPNVVRPEEPKGDEKPRITGGPPMSPVLGDMTPGWAEWLLGEHGPDAVREHYKGRLHLLPFKV